MAAIKQKQRDNQYLFMNKDIHKAVITRTRLRNRFLKEATSVNRLLKKQLILAYKKQKILLFY